MFRSDLRVSARLASASQFPLNPEEPLFLYRTNVDQDPQNEQPKLGCKGDTERVIIQSASLFRFFNPE
jgi:hypothetical protein